MQDSLSRRDVRRATLTRSGRGLVGLVRGHVERLWRCCSGPNLTSCVPVVIFEALVFGVKATCAASVRGFCGKRGQLLKTS